jgi:hypothetical protein
MAWAKWLIPTVTLNDELRIETQVRSLRACKDLQQIIDLSVMMLRQNHSYSEIIKNATRHIAELELREMLVESKRNL